MQAAPPSSEAASAGGGGSSAQADADADAEAALDAALASSEEGEDESSSDDDNSVVSDTKKSQRSTGSAQKRKRRARPGGSAGGGAAAEKRTLRARAGGGGVRDISDNESVYSGETSEASNEVDSDDDDSSEEEEGRVKAGDKGKGSGGDKEKGKGKGKAASKGKGKAKAKKRKAKRAKREPPHYEDLDPDDPYAALKHLIGRRVHFETARRPSSRHVERQREAEDMLVELEGEIEEGLLQARAEPAPKALPEIDVSEPVHVEVQLLPEIDVLESVQVEVQVSPEETKAKDAAQALAEKAAEMAQKAAHAAGGRRAMRVGAHKFVQGHGALGGEEIVEGVIGDSAQPGDTFEFQKPQPRPPSGQMGGAAAGAAGGGGGAARKVFVMPLSNTLTEEQHQAEYEKDKKAQADLAAHLKQFLEKENDSGADHNDNGSGDESEEDDAFLREHVLPEKERNNKKRMWSERNKDWLDTQERKAREAAQGGGHKPTRKQKKNAVKEGATAADAVMQVSKAKKLSTKINYQVVAQGLNFTGAPEPEAAEEAAVKEPILPMFEMEEEEGGGGAAAAPVRKRQRITIQGTGNISQSITHPAPPAPMETEEGVEGGEAEDEVEDEVEAEGGDDLAARYDDVALAKAQLEGGFDDNYRSDDEDDEYY
ncbi:hypothetical protein JKP88DRAFT_301287 [Tribonema minus]|uniref:Brf1 TBP-binding domain-containing protein n=1 Tax=Tribonema minus TaxID=303371 RepID=A0A836CNF0_9STRA|nr:hypothetical protein JKP88DRAFT_301287 [Tribonema minus]